MPDVATRLDQSSPVNSSTGTARPTATTTGTMTQGPPTKNQAAKESVIIGPRRNCKAQPNRHTCRRQVSRLGDPFPEPRSPSWEDGGPGPANAIKLTRALGVGVEAFAVEDEPEKLAKKGEGRRQEKNCHFHFGCASKTAIRITP